MKKFVTTYFLIFFSLTILAQSYEWKAGVQKIDSSGFYKIILTPEVVSKLSPDLQDIRIYDEISHTEVPYVFQSETPVQTKQLFREYEIIDKRTEKNKFTLVTLNNPQQNKINNISLMIKNADVSKIFTLSGSDNKKEWFVIKDKFSITSINHPTETSEIRIINFPLSNYTYYQLKISDSTSSPLNILKAGFYDFYYENGKYTEVPGATISQTDSASQKKSYIKIKYSGTYCIDRLNFSFSAVPYFLRHATLYEKQERKIKKRKTETYYSPIASFDISSTDFNNVLLSNTKARELLLEIENEDNPPLKLQKLETYQLNRQLVAWLEGGKSYSLIMGNNNVSAPVYDLKHFQDKIPQELKTLSISEIVSTQNKNKNFESSWFTQKRIIWIALIAVIILLGIMTMRLVTDIKK